MELLKIILSAFASVVVLFVTTKLMGHRQIFQLSFFDYICGITVGSIAAELAIDSEARLASFVALIVYCIVSILLNLLSLRFPNLRRFINGEPVVIISGGKIYEKNMKKAKLDLNELISMCRSNGYFSLSDIELAVFEHNGRLSIMPKESKRPVNSNDLCIPTSQKPLPKEIILDGRVISSNLKSIGKDAAWLDKVLKKAGVKRPEEVMLGTADSDGECFFFKKA